MAPNTNLPDSVDCDIALAFFEVYCKEHEFFTGGDVLEAFRQNGTDASRRNWRNVWASKVVNQAKARNWIRKAGRVSPTSKQSHTGSLAQWQSLRYQGVPSAMGQTARERLNDLKKQFKLRDITLDTLVWRAYELGVEVKI